MAALIGQGKEKKKFSSLNSTAGGDVCFAQGPPGHPRWPPNHCQKKALSTALAMAQKPKEKNCIVSSSIPQCWSTQLSRTQSHTKRHICNHNTIHRRHPPSYPACSSKDTTVHAEAYKHINTQTYAAARCGWWRHVTVCSVETQIPAKCFPEYAEIDTNSSHVVPITNLSTCLQTQVGGKGSCIVEPLPTWQAWS